MPTSRFKQGTVTALRVPLFLWLAWAQALWWRTDRQGRWSDLAPVPPIGVGSVTKVAGR